MNPIPSGSIRVGSSFRTIIIKLSDVASGINDKQHHCIITDNEERKYGYPCNVKAFIKRFPILPLLLIHKSKMVCCDYIMVLDKKDFNPREIAMKGGTVIKGSRNFHDEAKEHFENDTNPSWLKILNKRNP